MAEILLATCLNCGAEWNLREAYYFQDTAIHYQDSCPVCGCKIYRIPAYEKEIK